MVLVDNTVISNFVKVNRLDLLQVFKEIFVTSDVLEEFKFGVKRGVLPEVELEPSFKVLNLNESEVELYESLRRKLGKGEASSLVIAKNRGMKLLTDDLDARKTANILGIPVSGTIGVLMHCIKKKSLTLEEGNNILKDMVLKGYYSPIECLDEIDIDSN